MTTDALVLDLLEWLGPAPRPCIARRRVAGHGTLVSLSATGTEHLRTHRASAWSPPPGT